MDYENKEEETEIYHLLVNFDLIFETKFVFYSIVRFLNENLKFKQDLSQNWLQSLHFYNIDQFTHYFEPNIEPKTLKKLMLDKIYETELYKTIKPKIFFLHRLVNLITLIFNLSKILNEKMIRKKKNKEFQITIIHSDDDILTGFIEQAGNSIIESIENILANYIIKHSRNFDEYNKEILKLKIKFSTYNICSESLRTKSSLLNLFIDSNPIEILEMLNNNFLDQLSVHNQNQFFLSEKNPINLLEDLESLILNYFSNFLFFFKPLPKSEQKLNIDVIEEKINNFLKKAHSIYIKNDQKESLFLQNKNRFENFAKNIIDMLILQDEKTLLKFLFLVISNVKYKTRTFSKSEQKQLYDSNIFENTYIDLNHLINSLKNIYFNEKELKDVLLESALQNLNSDKFKENYISNNISIHSLFENSNENYFIEKFLNLNNFSEFIFKYNNSYLSHPFSYLSTWYVISDLAKNLTIEGIVTHGFKRGSKLLGVPTANLIPLDWSLIGSLLNGIYYGEFEFLENQKNNQSVELNKKYRGVLSIGYNPQFDNLVKTIEVFLIDFEGDDFYDFKVRLNIIGYMRTEAAFQNFEELVTCITYDIIVANSIFNERNTN